jgi:transcriptional regulator GlxA family with amidase domain
MTTRTVAIYLFEGMEPLDAIGPFEAFISALDGDGNELFDVGMVGETDAPVTATGGLVMVPRWTFETMPDPDILLVPGGEGTDTLTCRPEILEWVKAVDARTEFTLSVCTGAEVLAAAGLLKNLKATTYWNSYDRLRELEPTVDLLEGARWADNARIVCSSGVSAGTDMALHMISRMHGDDQAADTAHIMEYEHWPLRAA